jgi:hypothetical protein
MSSLRIIPKYDATGAGFGLEDDSGHICTFEDAPEAETYVKLFAAAPDMLEALKAVTAALNGRVHSNPALKALAEAEAAIARATS